MCLTSAPAALSKTRIFSRKLSEHETVLAYSNAVRNLAGRPNAMILPIPGNLSEADFFDTTLYADFMQNMEEAFAPRPRTLGLDTSKGFAAGPTVTRFKVGMYDIVLATQSWAPRLADYVRSGGAVVPQIQGALGQLSRPPEIRQELLEFYGRAYPGWALVICAFESAETMESQPIMFKYRPYFEITRGRLFYPAVDGHDGHPPDLTRYSQVAVDHFLFAGADNGFPVRFSGKDLPEWLATTKIVGARQTGSRRNGDWWLSSTLDKWDPYFERIAP